MNNGRRSYAPEFKLKMATQIVAGAKTVAELSREYQIKDSVLYRWRDEFLSHSGLIFDQDKTPASALDRIAELERIIGQQHVELECLKKASKRLP
jgi:transposase-like protein